MNANLVHKFPITDEEYNPVEEGVLNVKQRVPLRMPLFARGPHPKSVGLINPRKLGVIIVSI